MAPKRIVTTCPHCLHTLKNEYPAFGGDYQVVHHSQLINELIGSGRLLLKSDGSQTVTFHDPCYLGRQNQIIAEPRHALEQARVNLVEMPNNKLKSFCCGAGGAQMWKEEEHGSERVSTRRFNEAQATGADTLAVGCPFCMVMLTDAAREANASLDVLDIAEIIAERI